jgi:toxin FitB
VCGWLTAVAIGAGLELIPRLAASEIFSAFADQVLPFEAAAAEHYAVIVSGRERAWKPIAGFGALIAAVRRSRGAALATRNVSDFDGTGIEIIDPWLQ